MEVKFMHIIFGQQAFRFLQREIPVLIEKKKSNVISKMKFIRNGHKHTDSNFQQ